MSGRNRLFLPLLMRPVGRQLRGWSCPALASYLEVQRPLGPGQAEPVFQLIIGEEGWSFTPIYPGGGCCLVLDSAGRLYGDFYPGENQWGALGQLSSGSDGWIYEALYNLGANNGRDGWWPIQPLSLDSRANIYGTTYSGGGIGLPNCTQGDGCGVAFELVHNPIGSSATGLWTYEVIHRFASTPTDGQNPNGSLTLDAQGNAYGTTPLGGPECLPAGCGTVFKLSRVAPSLWTETILYAFPATPACSEGCAPAYNLAFDKAGNLYGVAGGGDNSCAGTCGVVFKLIPQPKGQWSYSVVHEFHGPDGANPLGLAIDPNGNLFGTTQTGGTYNLGVVFEITP